MQPTDTAFHQSTIVTLLPAWARQLPASHIGALFSALRADYLDEQGKPFSWYASAEASDQSALRQALTRREQSRKASGEALAGLQGITAFCQPLLADALNIGQPVTQAQYVFQPWKLVADPDLVGLPSTGVIPADIKPSKPQADGPPQRHSLLAAALGNFVAGFAAGPLSTLQNSTTDTTALSGLALPTFIETCRSLDLGKRYQQHLEAVFEGPEQAMVERACIRASRDELLVQAHTARMQALLSKAGHAMLLQLCADDPAPSYAGRRVSVRWLELFGTPIHEVLVIGPQDDAQVNPCVLYIPGLGQQSLREFPSASAIHEHLATRMLQTDLRRLLIGYAPTPLQPALARQLQAALFERLADGRNKPRPSPVLRLGTREVGATVWKTLYADHLQRLKANARAIAVPTADVDAAAWRERLEHWLEIGLDVLNVAALAVPGLNVPMLAIFGAQIMGEVFHGIESWEHGENAEALAHVESLLVNALTIGAFAGATKALKASGFVDAMQEILIEGKRRLWRPSLKGYAVETLPDGLGKPDAQGLRYQGDERYINMNGQHYKVMPDEQGRWCVQHPADPQAYRPRLHHDGQGAWRMEHDSPLTWAKTELLRRVGHHADGLSDTQLRTIAKLVDLSPGALLRSRVINEPSPSLLIDAMVRVRCDIDTLGIVSAVREGKPLSAHYNFAPPELPNLPGWPKDVRVKVYKGPEPWGESVTYANQAEGPGLDLELTRTQLQNGDLARTVVSQLDEPSLLSLLGDQTPASERAQRLQSLLADRLQGKREEIFNRLYERAQPTPSVPAKRIGEQFPGLPIRVLEEIASHANANDRVQLSTPGAKLPLRVAEEARRCQARVRLDRALMGLYRPELSNQDSQKLIQQLTRLRPELQGDTPGCLQALLADRPLARRLLGQQPIRPGWRSPLRISDGRIGYPLSGRGSAPENINARLRALFPAMDNGQINALRNELRRLPGTLAERIFFLGDQWLRLDNELNEWVQAAPAEQRQSREAFAAAVRGAWRRESGDTLTLSNMQLQTVPALPSRMDHITTIILENAGVEQVEPAFLHSFPNLRTLRCIQNVALDARSLFESLRNASRLETLDLNSNMLRYLPGNALPTLSGLPRLRQLSLRYNSLQLNVAQLRDLTQLPLESLDLHANALVLDETTQGFFADMVHLRTLDLGFNPLGIAPDLGFLARLESLDLSRAELIAWPDGLTTLMNQRNFQLRRINLSQNDIQTLPGIEAILATPYAEAFRGNRRDLSWLFNYNGLAEADALRLRESGLVVYEDPATSQSEPEGEPLSWRAQGSAQQREHWDALFAEPENTPLADILQRLTQSSDAQQDAQGLGRRVWQLLDRVIADDGLRQRIVELTREYPATCGDAGADAFSALELEVQAYDLGSDEQTSGWDLFLHYRRLYRRTLVNEAADRISLRRQLRRTALVANTSAEALPTLDAADDISDEDLRNYPVDDIEIRLALRLALSGANRLNFPEPSRGMLYRATAMVDDSIEDNVEEAVERLAGNTEQMHDWLMAEPAWILYLERERPEAFEDFNDRWANGFNYLIGLYELEDGPLGDEVSVAIGNALGSAPFDEQGQLRPRGSDIDLPAEAETAYNAERQHAKAVLLKRLTKEQAAPPRD
ncbi:dermonecrotic toxin domain-containing protein [Pseudomonas sp. NPDC089406]|uniref:dermonecrotic toxin domain-containing protein n=1 Tax=Pseudomonas sp. NPDC089406 TaxID=3364463 RepID=UPI00384CC3C1